MDSPGSLVVLLGFIPNVVAAALAWHALRTAPQPARLVATVVAGLFPWLAVIAGLILWRGGHWPRLLRMLGGMASAGTQAPAGTDRQPPSALPAQVSQATGPAASQPIATSVTKSTVFGGRRDAGVEAVRQRNPSLNIPKVVD